MIYFDSAATSYYRPPCVKMAVAEAIDSFGNPSRGAHGASLSADRCMFETRLLLTELFHGPSPFRTAFSMNATGALNTAIFGMDLHGGDHLIISPVEHNSVLRPAYRLREKGVDVRMSSLDERGVFDPVSFERILKEIRERDSTGRIVSCLSHGSNVTGNVLPVHRLSEICRNYEAILILDAAQTAGILPIDMEKDGIDVLCFSGHKGLLGPQGTGGLMIREGLELSESMTGGSGVQTFLRTMPKEMPAHLEAGTQNAHSIAGLRAALQYADGRRADFRRKEEALRKMFLEGLSFLGRKTKITIYGDQEAPEHLPTVSFNLGDLEAAEVSDALWQEHEIAVRAGGHCAPLLHAFFGTEQRGIVRVSFCHENTEEQIKALLTDLEEIASGREL